eukprot:TRINITY_DN3633_c0_g3_i1.p1 TRINITY_DN3633_c0_g3~~TRINITY_DN3633_c0_g3_i1.p1  ORF type:complete len:450 (-),score=103.89 TRINITY_DN3633_c0_g3_i1:158-1402(-)
MKGGFLKKARPGEKEEASPGQKEWSDDEVELMAKVFAEILDENSWLARKDLERRVRTGTGVREFRGRCGVDPTTGEPESERDVASRLIQQHTKHSSLCDMVAPIMEQASDIFGRVKAKGEKDGMKMDSESEIKVLRDVIKECLIRHALKLINSETSESYAAGSHDAGLLATPQGYFAGDLNLFSADTIKNLMEVGYGYQDVFVDESIVNDVKSEMDFLDYDGKFVEVQQQKMTGYRKDRIGWFTLESLDREKQRGLAALFKQLISVPFELNKKCSLYLQAGGNFQLACYPKDAYYKKHVDGGYDDTNNGRKITAVFYPNTSWVEGHGGHIKMYKRRKNPFQVAKAKSNGEEVNEAVEDEPVEEIAPVGGRILLFRSRDMPHEVMVAQKKRYAVSFWMMGPAGPGDQPEDHHTPT